MDERPTDLARAQLADYGKKIRTLRLKKDVSQEDVSRSLGMGKSWLSQVELGQIDVPLSRLLALLGVLEGEILIRPRADLDPQLALEEALSSDESLSPQARGWVMAAYTAARQGVPLEGQRDRRRASRRSPVPEPRQPAASE